MEGRSGGEVRRGEVRGGCGEWRGGYDAFLFSFCESELGWGQRAAGGLGWLGRRLVSMMATIAMVAIMG